MPLFEKATYNTTLYGMTRMTSYQSIPPFRPQNKLVALNADLKVCSRSQTCKSQTIYSIYQMQPFACTIHVFSGCRLPHDLIEHLVG